MLPSVRPVRLAPTGLAVLVAATCLAGLLPAAASAATVTPSVTREAESMVLTPSAGATFPDPQASGRAGLLLWSNGMARGGVVSSEPALAVRVTARGDQCGGAPTMRLVVDGAAVGTASVTSATWSTYTFPVQAPAGRHGFRIWFDNDHRDASCDRNLRLDRVDWLSLDTATAPSPTAPPAPVRRARHVRRRRGAPRRCTSTRTLRPAARLTPGAASTRSGRPGWTRSPRRRGRSGSGTGRARRRSPRPSVGG